MSLKIIHIVPEFPPHKGGVGHYAYKIGTDARNTSENFFIICNPDHKLSGDSIHDARSSVLKKRHARSLLEILKKLVSSIKNSESEIIILLHYVGHGYNKRGVPLWLLNGFELIRNNLGDIKIKIFFHELFASSKNPLTSTFWTSKIQRYIARRLYALGSSIYTSSFLYKSILENWDNSKKVIVLPVFSNIGEMNKFSQIDYRKNQLVIFGSIENRRRIYQNSLIKINRICKNLGINEIIDIGEPFNDLISSNNELKITQMGYIPDQEVSDIMKHAFAGIIDYLNMPLEKSGIFAAYVSHGLLAIVINSNEKGLYIEGKHYINLDSSLAQVENVAAKGFEEYYNSSSISKHILTFLNTKL